MATKQPYGLISARGINYSLHPTTAEHRPLVVESESPGSTLFAAAAVIEVSCHITISAECSRLWFIRWNELESVRWLRREDGSSGEEGTQEMMNLMLLVSFSSTTQGRFPDQR